MWCAVRDRAKQLENLERQKRAVEKGLAAQDRASSSIDKDLQSVISKKDFGQALQSLVEKSARKVSRNVPPAFLACARFPPTLSLPLSLCLVSKADVKMG